MGLSKTRFINFRMGKSFQIVTENTEALTELLKDIWLSSERREEKLWFVLFLSFLHSHYMQYRNNAETAKTTLRSNQLISIFPVIKAEKQIIPKLVPKTTIYYARGFYESWTRTGHIGNEWIVSALWYQRLLAAGGDLTWGCWLQHLYILMLPGLPHSVKAGSPGACHKKREPGLTTIMWHTASFCCTLLVRTA